MPTTKRDLPGTIRRSPEKAQETWAKTHDSAVEQYGEGERAHRTAFASLKWSYEKVGDHWEKKDEKGPSDEQATLRGRAPRRARQSAGGVDVMGHTRDELLERAKKLDVKGRHAMTKHELGRAIANRQD